MDTLQDAYDRILFIDGAIASNIHHINLVARKLDREMDFLIKSTLSLPRSPSTKSRKRKRSTKRRVDLSLEIEEIRSIKEECTTYADELQELYELLNSTEITLDDPSQYPNVLANNSIYINKTIALRKQIEQYMLKMNYLEKMLRNWNKRKGATVSRKK